MAPKILLAILFGMGYFFITIEHFIKINKATSALLMAVVSWMILFYTDTIGGSYETVLYEHLATISEVILFLLGALTIVETINVYSGFSILQKAIQTQSSRKIPWIMGFLTFFMSAILDNLTTTLVMVTTLTKLMEPSKVRLLIGGGIVIAANAGGVFTPIGDVTTTMLWIGGQLTAFSIMKSAFWPSITSVIVSLAVIAFSMERGKVDRQGLSDETENPLGTWILILGISLLLMVPILKMAIGLPPYMGMLLGLGLMWLVTDWLHAYKNAGNNCQIPHVLAKIDLSGVLFFLGILLAVAALDASKLLLDLAHFIENKGTNPVLISLAIGLLSSVVDNVPLVAMSMAMYSLDYFPQDDLFWRLTAYTAGTGGSMLVIGSAAGIVYMGLERVHFFWYLRNISLAALIGFLAGFAWFVWFA